MVDNYKKFFEDIEESQITEIPYKNIEKKIYESYFQNTQQLKNHFKDSDLIEIIMENSQKIGRKFKKKMVKMLMMNYLLMIFQKLLLK